jgi:hypothetical protein
MSVSFCIHSYINVFFFFFFFFFFFIFFFFVIFFLFSGVFSLIVLLSVTFFFVVVIFVNGAVFSFDYVLFLFFLFFLFFCVDCTRRGERAGCHRWQGTTASRGRTIPSHTWSSAGALGG